ncbi:hypothetical protein B1A_02046, partial [mine drainage metagenome]
MVINGNYYNLSSASYTKPTVSNNRAYDNISATYVNGAMNTSDYKNMNIKLYDQGSQAISGSLNYQYFVKYDNKSYSLSSAPVPTTFGNPIHIFPISSAQWITMNFAPIKKPIFINSQMAFSWSKMISSSYLVNNTQKNTIFVVPAGVNITMNLSNAFYNPVNQKYDYNSP